jgi:tartrate dehydrogenase/decarboxylase/D-malate dehydrogenase
MNTYSIAIYPGDGIGIEVTKEALKALKAVEDLLGGVKFQLTEFNWGSRYWKETGSIVPDNYLETLKDFNAIFLGALGDPENVPDHVTLVPLIEMRQSFDQYICLRPAKLLPGIASPLAGKGFGDIDMVVVRENSEGEYSGVGGRFRAFQGDEVSLETALHTRKGIERVTRYAFRLAQRRSKRLALATKSNALKHSMVLWDHVFLEVSKDFPGVQIEKFHVDAMTMHMVRSPERFDVVVASNLFGDILSDLSGAISGSLGLAPSANINPEGKYPSLFEPVHGSAPDIAGKGLANPIAAIRSIGMLLDFLGETQGAQAVEDAVVDNLKDGNIRTPDIGGRARTGEVGDDIAMRIRSKV